MYPLSAATATALQILQGKNPNKSITLKSAETVTKNGIPYMHIINANNNNGFVILAADSMYSPLLAFDSIGNFNKSNMNLGLAMWFNKQGHELDCMRNTRNFKMDSIATVNKGIWRQLGSKNIAAQIAGKPLPTPTAHTNGVYTGPPTTGHVVEVTGTGPFYIGTVGPLCPTLWQQNNPWNQYCPYDGNSFPGYNGYTAAGCTPLAMAQIMYYWKYPNNMGYDWQNMAVDLNSLSTQAAKSAKLIADVGQTQVGNGTFTSYGDATNDGSGGSLSNDEAAPAVFAHFLYSAQEEKTLFDQFISGARNGTAYADQLTDELYNQHRPCMLGGYPNIHTIAGLVYWAGGIGHNWVCDGSQQWMASQTFTYYYYDSNNNLVYTEVDYSPPYPVLRLLHMNWGYGPNANNGWYDCTEDFTTTITGDYQYFQTLIYNIHP